MKQEFRAFFKKATMQGEKVEMLLSALSEAEGVFDACRMSGKTVIVTLEDIQQELPLDQEVEEADEAEGMEELPFDKPNVTVNNYYVNQDTGEVEEPAGMLPGETDEWVETSHYADAIDADVAEIEDELEEGEE